MKRTKTAIILTPIALSCLILPLVHSVALAKSKKKDDYVLVNDTNGLSIYDDGTLKGGLRAFPFDGEGSPTRRTLIVEGGRPTGRLYDHCTAIINNAESTGNAFRASYREAPRLDLSNVVVESGEQGLDEMIEETKEGFEISQVSASQITDDCVYCTLEGFEIKDGAVTASLKRFSTQFELSSLLMPSATARQLVNVNNFIGPAIEIHDVDLFPSR